MKIIRIRSGFTTNSSSASEWVPPEGVGPNGEDLSAEPDSQVLQSGTETPAPAPGILNTNNPVISLGLIGLAILLLFLIEEAVRRVLKKLKKKKHEESH